MGFTKAYKCWMKGQHCQYFSSPYPYTQDYTETSYSCKATNGTFYSTPFLKKDTGGYRQPFETFYPSNNSSNGSSFFVVGTDSTPESVLDYKITDAGISCTVQSSIITSNPIYKKTGSNGNTYFDYILTVFNTKSSSVTLNEIGLYYFGAVHCVSSTSGLNSYTNTFLMWRKVLDTPLTLEAGETVIITVHVEWPMSV